MIVLLGALAVGAALALVVRELLDAGEAPLEQVAARATATAERTLVARGWQASLERALEQAGVATRPADAVVVVGCLAVAGALLGLTFGDAATALLLAVGVPLAGALGLRVRRSRRRAAFADQVLALLPSLAASLRAGHGLVQAFELAGTELDQPARGELRRVAAEVHLGRDLVEAVSAMAERFDNEELRWLVSAIEIHREVGGDLTVVLDRVTETIRRREHLTRQVRTLTAEGRTSAKVMLLLPIGAAGAMSVINRGFVQSMTTGSGLVFLVAAVVLVAVGGVWLRAVTRVEL